VNYIVTGKEGEYRWVGTGKVTNFTNWNHINPDNSGGNENCCEILKIGSTSAWNDRSCATISRFICELPQEITS
jgi:hypothetical protein